MSECRFRLKLRIGTETDYYCSKVNSVYEMPVDKPSKLASHTHQ